MTVHGQSVHMHFKNIFDWGLVEYMEEEPTDKRADCIRIFLKERIYELRLVHGRIPYSETGKKKNPGKRPA